MKIDQRTIKDDDGCADDADNSQMPIVKSVVRSKIVEHAMEDEIQ